MSRVRPTQCNTCAASNHDNHASMSLQVTPVATALNAHTPEQKQMLKSQAKTMQALYVPGSEAMTANALDDTTAHVNVPNNDLQGLVNAIRGSGLTMRATYLQSLDHEAICAELSPEVAQAALDNKGTAIKLDAPFNKGAFCFVTDGKRITQLQYQAT